MKLYVKKSFVLRFCILLSLCGSYETQAAKPRVLSQAEFGDLCGRLFAKTRKMTRSLRLSRMPIKLHPTADAKSLYTPFEQGPDGRPDFSDANGVEREYPSATLYARLRRKLHRESTAYIPWYNYSYIPGFDGVVFSRRGKPVANIELKRVTDQSKVTRKLGEAVKSAQEFSSSQDAWRKFFGKTQIKRTHAKRERWLAEVFAAFGINFEPGPRGVQLSLSWPANGLTLPRFELEFQEGQPRLRSVRVVIHLDIESGHAEIQGSWIKAAEKRLEDNPAIESVEFFSDREYLVITRERVERYSSESLGFVL